MNKNDLFQAFDNVDDNILERSETPAGRRRAPAYRKWLALAACLALTVTLMGVAFAAEAREYGAAVAFFDENGLSTEGLSRSDVKAVYRDITSQHFTYDKTAEVIERAVPGLEISQRDPTPEELAQVEAAVRSCQPFDEVLHTRAGCTVSSHCGPRTLGILYFHTK